MADKPTKTDDTPAPQGQISFEYIKSAAFRVVHVDGVVGGPGPSGEGYVVMNVFSERMPIPKRQTFELKSNGTLGPERVTERVERRGVVREVEAALVLNLPTAKLVVEWLGNAIGKAEKHQADLKVKFRVGKEEEEE